MVRAATIEQIDAAVTILADRLRAVLPDEPTPEDPASEDPAPEDLAPDQVAMTVDDRRVHALRLLAAGRPDELDADLRDLMPTVNLHLHAYAGGTERGADGRPVEAIARLEGHGPVTESWISRVLGRSCRFVIRPVLDLAGQAPVDAYEIPERHRRARAAALGVVRVQLGLARGSRRARNGSPLTAALVGAPLRSVRGGATTTDGSHRTDVVDTGAEQSCRCARGIAPPTCPDIHLRGACERDSQPDRHRTSPGCDCVTESTKEHHAHPARPAVPAGLHDTEPGLHGTDDPDACRPAG
ncbi:hypothetical protein [Nocardioides sp. SYSU DS0663]|uniref:hypothetical protein n=1 Tax=Nocardioides sp. SYSU DS0663 TaxID=3416445 RepID=UPI003F4B4522